jgi:hypothetical protein
MAEKNLHWLGSLYVISRGNEPNPRSLLHPVEDLLVIVFNFGNQFNPSLEIVKII